MRWATRAIRREKVEGDADREWKTGAGPCQRRKEGGKACDDHERAEAALGAAPPGDQPTEYVRESDPIHERGLDARLAYLIARKRKRDRTGRRPAAGERDRQEEDGVLSGGDTPVGTRHECGSGDGHVTRFLLSRGYRQNWTEPFRRNRSCKSRDGRG